jgi:predicted ArsR family transcriptional regulator
MSEITTARPSPVGHHWTFLTNHAHVLLCLAEDPELRVRDIAVRVGITERAALRILRDLADAGYLERVRVGRRNLYRLRLDGPMRHPVESGRPVRVLVDSFAAERAVAPG